MLSGVCYEKSNKNLRAKALLYCAYGIKGLRLAEAQALEFSAEMVVLVRFYNYCSVHDNFLGGYLCASIKENKTLYLE